MAQSDTKIKFIYNEENLQALQRLVGRMMHKIGINRKERFLVAFSLMNLLQLWFEYVKPKKISIPEISMRLRINRGRAYVVIVFDTHQDDMLEYLSSLPVNRKRRLNLAQKDNRNKNSFVAHPHFKWLLLVDLLNKLDYIREGHNDRIEMEYTFGTNLAINNLSKVNKGR